jgi:hypothetical protein
VRGKGWRDSIADDRTVERYVAALREAPGVVVVEDQNAKTAVATEGGVVVFRAMRKSRGAWIVMTQDGATVKWHY